MLKKFLFNALSSFVGAWIAIIIVIVGIILFILGLTGSIISSHIEQVKSHSVMKIVLGGSIQETETAPQLDYSLLLSGKIEQPQTLKNLTEALNRAKTDNNIDAVFIECEGASAAPATLDALRNAVLDFKKSGKRVFAYGDNLTMGDYFVSTAADALYLNPDGNLDLQGLSGTTLYFKDLLDKIGVDVEMVRVGSFKSAIEPYTSNQMSEPAKMQLDSLYGEMWTYILRGISEQRKVKSQTIDSLVNNLIFLDKASVAKEYKLIDNCLYHRQVIDEIANYVGSERKDLNFVSPTSVLGPQPYSSNKKDQIAVLYAVGDIAEFEGAGINCHELVPLIVNLAENEDVKGLVLRVNSPGGSVFGSQQIGEALDYFKSKGKPLAVSMGDYAASGGYWISAKADIIYADPLTITGSIGIFGLVPNVSKLVDNLGIHPQTVSTNPGVMFPSIFYQMTEKQHEALQQNVERGYEMFVNRVAEGRHKSPEYIKSIAEGRIWNAIKAKELGLVDMLGGLDNAVTWMTEKTKLPHPNIVSYPAPVVSILNLLANSNIQNNDVKAITEKLTEKKVSTKVVSFIGNFLEQKHVQARSPYIMMSL